MTAKPVVLFLCTHNAGRSLAAKVLLDHYAQDRIDVRSAGSEPAEELNPSVVAVLKERGLDPSKEFPKPLTKETAQAADVVVTMGCGDTCPYYRGKTYVDWELTDPAGLPIPAVRPIIDDIDGRVRELLSTITRSAPLAQSGAKRETPTSQEASGASQVCPPACTGRGQARRGDL